MCINTALDELAGKFASIDGALVSEILGGQGGGGGRLPPYNYLLLPEIVVLYTFLCSFIYSLP
jgi:hypothetical protein